jgi:hypothetical protein
VGARVGRRPGKPAAVRLGDLQAYVWRNVEERGGKGPITLYAAGTDTGMAVLACRGQGAALARCNAAAGSLAVPEGLPAELGQLGAWSDRLDSVMTRLSSRRSRDRARLRAAKTPNRSASAARQLAKDYSLAEKSLKADRAPVGAAPAQRQIERSLAGIGASYRRLASAAKRQSRSRYRAASDAIASRESDLKRILRGL